MKITDWTLPGARNQPIFASTHTATTPRGILVICHGFKGYKDYGFFPHLAQAAAQTGLTSHRFNFSHSGMTPQIETFERPDLFEQDTWATQVEDLHRIIAYVGSQSEAPIVLFGHSRGGITCLLAAAQPTRPVAGIIVAAAPHEACHLDPDQQQLLRTAGRLPSPSARTGQILYVGRSWLDEIERDPAASDPVTAITKVGRPRLLIYGEKDPTVPLASMKTLQAAAPDSATLLIPNASHTFNCPNPLPLDQSPPPPTQALIDATIAFALLCIKSGSQGQEVNR